MATSNRTGLLDLPAELRTSIYKYVFEDFEVDIIGSGYRPEEYVTYSNKKRSLLLTCKCIYNEALTTAASMLTVNFKTAAPAKWFTELTKTKLLGMRKYFELVKHITVEANDVRGVKFLSNFPRLVNLHFHVRELSSRHRYNKVQFRSLAEVKAFCEGTGPQQQDVKLKNNAQVLAISKSIMFRQLLDLTTRTFRVILEYTVYVSAVDHNWQDAVMVCSSPPLTRKIY
jgi:hypothetical protein